MIAIIPAKSTSERIPGKNTKLLNGRPLLDYTIIAAHGSKMFKEVWVSSENLELLQALPEGVKRHLRPSYLASSTASVVSVCKDALRALDVRFIESFAVLLPTSPLRSVDDIQQAVKLYQESKTECVMSVTETDAPEYVLTVCERGRLHAGPDIAKKRQELEPSYKHDGSIIICKTEAFLAVNDFYDLDTIPLIIPRERAVDINEQADWDYAEYLLRGK